ncbi:ABC transporter substrate-binding protein [Lipingzhangella halophila]|nr:ABC transporter substrate-binding protein [Lipingzhangella halophila]
MVNSYPRRVTPINLQSSALEDDDLAVVGLTNGNIFRVVVPEDSEIHEPEDLAGATIGASSLSTVSAMNAEGLVDAAGLDADADVEYLPVGYGAQAAEAFENGDIDAYSGYDGPNVVIGDLLGTELREIPSPINDISGTSALIVRASAVENEAEHVIGLSRAFFKSTVFAEENPEAAISMHWEEFPQSRSAEMDDDEAMEQSVRILNQRLDVTGGRGDDGTFGVQDDKELQQTLDFFADVGIISEEVNVEESGLFDYSLAEEYNKFDEEAVRQEAASWDQKST